MNVYEKLLTIQSKLKAPKSQYNSFGKYHYRNCEDILEAVKPLAGEVKALVYLTDSIEMIGERYYVKATATFVDCEKPEQTISVSAYAREEKDKKGMDGSQVTGASSSYARKYALNGLFDIDDNKDSDTTNNGSIPEPEKPKKQTKAGLSEDTRNKINLAILEYKKVAKAEVKEILAIVEAELGFSVNSVNDEKRAKEVLNLLNDMTTKTANLMNGKGA